MLIVTSQAGANERGHNRKHTQTLITAAYKEYVKQTAKTIIQSHGDGYGWPTSTNRQTGTYILVQNRKHRGKGPRHELDTGEYMDQGRERRRS